MGSRNSDYEMPTKGVQCGIGLLPDGFRPSDADDEISTSTTGNTTNTPTEIPTTTRSCWTSRRMVRCIGALAVIAGALIVIGAVVGVAKNTGGRQSKSQSMEQQDQVGSGKTPATITSTPSPTTAPVGLGKVHFWYPTTWGANPAPPTASGTSTPAAASVSSQASTGAPTSGGTTAPSAAPVRSQASTIPPTPAIGATTSSAATSCEDAIPIYTDVVIIGAGVAGISAAAQIKKVSGGALGVTILESRSELGGRVQTQQFGPYKVQRGATWLNPGNPITDQYEASGLVMAKDNFLNATVFEYSCGQTGGGVRNLRGQEQHPRIDRHKLETILDRLEKDDSLEPEKKVLARRYLRRIAGASDDAANERSLNGQCTCSKVPAQEWDAAVSTWKNGVLPCVEEKVDMFWEEDFEPEADVGLMYEYAACNWDSQDPLEYLVKYLWHDWEYATHDGSVFSWFDPYSGQDFYLARDDWAKSLRDMAQMNDVAPMFDHRVEMVDYNHYDANDSRVRAQVYAKNSAGACSVYKAQRVISTVSAGVYNNNLIQFYPVFSYSEAQHNPLKVQNYVKIFYRFSTKFWGANNEDHYILTVKGQNPDGVSLHWQNYDRQGLYPGSNMLLLTLVGDDFEDAVGTANVRNEIIPESVLQKLLEPLEVAFPDEDVTPVDWYYNTFHADPDFGYGAYAQWAQGYSPEDYFHFWGAYDFNDYVDECDHNGCNDDDEWILYLSGTNACMDDFEFVHSGYYGGYFSANLMLQSLGFDLDFKEFEKCYS